ncbi:MAG: hypothetical protein Q7S40_02820 [Opitutaceae bacterium]|nr:hypothetical protein [Opitutaceae bacterium]
MNVPNSLSCASGVCSRFEWAANQRVGQDILPQITQIAQMVGDSAFIRVICGEWIEKIVAVRVHFQG